MTVTVAVTGSRAEAELIVGMLQNNGIRAAVSADDAGAVDLALQAQGVRVLVPDGDEGRARHLLQTNEPEAPKLNRLQRLVVRLLGGDSER
jgi:hypothetical protein